MMVLWREAELHQCTHHVLLHIEGIRLDMHGQSRKKLRLNDAIVKLDLGDALKDLCSPEIGFPANIYI